ncbi:MAG: class E sortase [Methanobacterium sp.]
MLKYKILSVAIIIGCILVCSTIIMAGYEKSQQLSSYNTALKTYGNKSSPINALNPSITRSASSGIQSSVLIIPKMGVNAKISSSTVNAYNTVYHYPESVNPGQPGECGFLSHRTKYSGLFGKLGNLQVGDEVIVKDYAINKKYIYKVTSNGNDIRWDYETNPIQFDRDGEARLLLITCYPPGKKQAAYITHCKLVSTTSLN